jgi:outer membrane protein insertion porin family
MKESVGPMIRALSLVCRLLALLAVVAASACVPQAPGARGPFPLFAEFEGLEVQEVQFRGQLELPRDSLRNVVVTRGPRCWLLIIPLCLPFTDFGRDDFQLDLDELSRDVVRLQLYYRDHGFYGTQVVPSVDRTGGEEVVVRFAISAGDRVLLRALEVTGAEEVIDSAQIRRALPLEAGEPFRRIGFLQSADTIRSLLLRRGYAYAEVLRNYSIDTIADVAEVEFVAVPGPLVYVDSIVFAGVNRLSQRTLRQQIVLDEGELLRVPELARSQRNLYDLEMVRFASLEIAPDSLQLDADSASATLLARIVEAPEYVVDAALGVGTVECVRTEAGFTDRNFVGGGRTLEIEGFVSRIGAGDPLSTSFGRRVCGEALDRELFGSVTDEEVDLLTYRLSANLHQPRLFQTRNELSVLLHAERITEVRAFLRQSVGGQVALGRELGANALLNTTLNVQRGRTLASPAAYCIGLDVCEAGEVRQLQDPRWSNVLSLTGFYDRVRPLGVVSRGYRLRGGVDWASELLASDDAYLRVLGDGAVFVPVRPGWVLAGNLRAGTFLRGALGGEDGFIPPERRFFAGGPSSVRGVPPNALGPTAYVITEQEVEFDTLTGEVVDARPRRSAIGGTRLLVASAELRAPSPFLPEFFRAAVFVDAGQVWAREEERDAGHLVVTPGVGVRVVTPVGPVRLDVAYNPRPLPEGRLFQLNRETGNLILIDPSFQPPAPGSFWDRLEFSFAIGQPF